MLFTLRIVLVSWFSILTVFNALECYGQNNKIVYVHKLFKYQGYIFPMDSMYEMPRVLASSRYTPSKMEIKEAEQIIAELRQNDDLRNSVRKISKGKRQYLGYLNENGEKIIWVNRLCGNDFKKRIKKEIVFVLGGGNCFWNGEVNLTTNEILFLVVNGVS